MGNKENRLIDKRLKNLPANVRLYRINVGMGWTASKKNTIIRKNKSGQTIVSMRDARPFYGAVTGYPDLTGWTEIEITPDMVGKKIAVFTAEEYKATGKPSPEQLDFKALLESMGGLFSVVRE